MNSSILEFSYVLEVGQGRTCAPDYITVILRLLMDSETTMRSYIKGDQAEEKWLGKKADLRGERGPLHVSDLGNACLARSRVLRDPLPHRNQRWVKDP